MGSAVTKFVTILSASFSWLAKAFGFHLLISEPPRVASRLRFECTPNGSLFGLHVNGKRVSFTENVFYEFRDERIEKVWLVIDEAAIESQL